MPKLIFFKHKWLVGFMTSHIFGWMATMLQTLWIIREIKRLKKSGE